MDAASHIHVCSADLKNTYTEGNKQTEQGLDMKYIQAHKRKHYTSGVKTDISPRNHQVPRTLQLHREADKQLRLSPLLVHFRSSTRALSVIDQQTER